MHFGFSTLCFLCVTPYNKKMKELTQLVPRTQESCAEEALSITEKNKSSIKD
jgi:hypothetical protein